MNKYFNNNPVREEIYLDGKTFPETFKVVDVD
jgi:hypothetical protein